MLEGGTGGSARLVLNLDVSDADGRNPGLENGTEWIDDLKVRSSDPGGRFCSREFTSDLCLWHGAGDRGKRESRDPVPILGSIGAAGSLKFQKCSSDGMGLRLVSIPTDQLTGDAGRTGLEVLGKAVPGLNPVQHSRSAHGRHRHYRRGRRDRHRAVRYMYPANTVDVVAPGPRVITL